MSDSEILSETIDSQDICSATEKGPWTSAFKFNYPLGFEEFSVSELVIRIGNTSIRGVESLMQHVENSDRCRPVEAAIHTIENVIGEVDALRMALKNSRAVALVATFRSGNRANALPHDLIVSLKNEGFLTVVIDASEDWSKEELNCDLLIRRKNLGWDFGSWMSVLAKFPWLIDESDRLLLINDSNLGPLAPLGVIMNRGRQLNQDVWGITDSWEIDYHLQSYFLCFEQSALRSGHLQTFVNNFPFHSEKRRIIESGEIGLSQFLLKQKMKIGVVYPYLHLANNYLETFENRIQDIFKYAENQFWVRYALHANIGELSFILNTVAKIRASVPLNPTHYFWDVLLTQGSPFIKRELVTKNPEAIPGLHRLPLIINREQVAALEIEAATWRTIGSGFSLPLSLKLISPNI